MPLYSLMIATEPLAAEVWDEIGLRRRETFADLRHMRIYGQRTADDRFAFGGRGAPYHFGSRTRPEFDRNERVHALLREVLVDLFPPVAGYDGHAPLGRRPRRAARLARVRGLRPRAAASPGAAATWATAWPRRTSPGARSPQLITGRESDLTRLPWVGHRSRDWEPEPLRWLGVNGGRAALELRRTAPRPAPAGPRGAPRPSRASSATESVVP